MAIFITGQDLLDDAYEDLSNALKSIGDTCAIVCCLKHTTCDELSRHLSKSCISCAGNQIFCNPFLVSTESFNFYGHNVKSSLFSGGFSSYHEGLSNKLY